MNKRQVVSLLESRIVENDANYFAQYICEDLEDGGYEITNEIYDIIGDSYFNLNESSSDEDVANNIVEHLEAAGYEIDEGFFGRVVGAVKGAWRGAKMAWEGSSREGMDKRNATAKKRRVKKSNKHNAIKAWSTIGSGEAPASESLK